MLRKASASSFPQAVPGRVERQGCAADRLSALGLARLQERKGGRIAFIGLLMKVATVLVLRPEQRDDLVDNFVVCHFAPCFPRASHSA